MTIRLPGESSSPWRARFIGAGVVLVLMATSFAFGRFSAAGTVVHEVNTVHETLTVASEKKATTDASSSSTGVAVDHTIEETHKPDGTVTIVKHDVQTKIEYRDVVRTVEVEKRLEVAHNIIVHRYTRRETAQPQWMVELMLGLTTSSSRVKVAADLAPPATAFAAIVPMSAGARLSRRIVGPVWGSVTITTDKSAFVGLGMEF